MVSRVGHLGLASNEGDLGVTNTVLVGDVVRLLTPTRWLQEPAQADVLRWVTEHGALEPPPHTDTVSVDLPRSSWLDWGSLPAKGADPEEEDIWRTNQRSLARLAGAAPQTLRLESVGHVGAAQFELRCSLDGAVFDLHGDDAPVTTPRGGGILLPPLSVALKLAMGLRAGHGKPREEQLAVIASLRALAARLDQLLGGEDVAAMAFDEHLASFRFEHVDRAALVWKVSGKNADVYDLTLERTTESGENVPIPVGSLHSYAPIVSLTGKDHMILAEDVDAVARIQKGYRNKLRKQVAGALADPAAILPSGRTFDGIDLARYSPRVAGFVPVVRADRPADIRSSGVEWYMRDDDSSLPFLRLEIAKPDGTGAILDFATPEDGRAFVQQANKSSTSEPLRVKDVDVIPTKPLIDRIEENLALYEKMRPDAGPPEPPPGDASERLEDEPAAKTTRLAAVIREVDEERPLEGGAATVDETVVPWSRLDALLLAGTALLKPHQRQGIAWLWRHYTAGRHGVLLADDMGLGKTLQLACFLALQRSEGKGGDRAKPTLIVAPVILLATWERELVKFFKPAVFESLLVLHDQSLRKRVTAGRLDVSSISQYDYVLTNYDTLARYQQQLLSVDYASLVLDEAQAVKNPDALRTLAARGLKRSFAICATGTPVENRLLDLWTLYEVLSPGEPFGRRADFERIYEADVDAGVKAVRGALLLPSAASTLLRRTKKEAQPSLPVKEEKVHHVAMTREQLDKERMVTRGAGRSVLETLQYLQKLYQHPRLLLRSEEAERRSWSTDDIIAESPKLRLCLDLLKEVRERGEKALVFTLWTTMQDLLVAVLRDKLALDTVRVINGETNQQRKAQTYLDEFERQPGFGVLVLSPLAAGTGLTITAANHVIHYGRWWNPAKEDQATDRAYRIGQTKPVTVHFPVLHHPDDPSAGFDVKLHELVSRKRAMARDFLDPRNADDVTASELHDTTESAR